LLVFSAFEILKRKESKKYSFIYGANDTMQKPLVVFYTHVSYLADECKIFRRLYNFSKKKVAASFPAATFT